MILCTNDVDSAHTTPRKSVERRHFCFKAERVRRRAELVRIVQGGDNEKNGIAAWSKEPIRVLLALLHNCDTLAL